MSPFTILVRHSEEFKWTSYAAHITTALIELRAPICYSLKSPSIIDQMVLGDIEEWDILPTARVTIGVTDIIRTPVSQFREKCSAVDCVVFPSHVASIPYLESGIDKPFFVIPFGTCCSSGPIARPSTPPFVFLFMAAIDGLHGAEYILRAFRQAFGDNKDVRLLMYNESSNLTRFSQLRQEYSHDNIIWLTSKADRGTAFASAHCLVHPSFENDFGHAVFESVAFGIPVVASRTAALMEYVDPRTFLFVEMSNSFLDRHTVDPRFTGMVRLPDLTHLIHCMREMFDRSSYYVDRQQQYFDSKGSWLHSTRHLVACILEARNLVSSE